eukprot:SAG11_NODE_10328_length_839_cov_1.128378_1_plen_50_part_10
MPCIFLVYLMMNTNAAEAVSQLPRIYKKYSVLLFLPRARAVYDGYTSVFF